MKSKNNKNDTTSLDTSPFVTQNQHDSTDSTIMSMVEEPYEINDETITSNTENFLFNPPIVEKKKRGRKKCIKPNEQENKNSDTKSYDNTTTNMNLNSSVIEVDNNDVHKKEKKPRKQRVSKKGQQTQEQKEVDSIQVQDNFESNDNNKNIIVDKDSCFSTFVHKKRGRKPRGGKIIHENLIQKNNNPEVPNIILHLKCLLSDLKKSNELNSSKLEVYSNDKKLEILCYNDNDHDENSTFSSNVSNMTKYETDTNNTNTNTNGFSKDKHKELREKEETTSSKLYDPLTFSSKNIHPTPIPIINETNLKISQFSFYEKELDQHENELDFKNGNNKDIWKKISQLKLNFYNNDSLGIQRSSCFWDTCEFDTPPIHIPLSSTKGYGCFCHPECAVAFLMNENIDTSVKFERYYLLNSIYGPIYNYNKSIKPAPNPYYLLNKFYGNLTINEYRKLFQCEQVIYIVNKPLTNVLPELYEDNNDFFVGNKIIQNNTIEIKKKVSKNAKSSIINEVFGIK